MKTLSGLKSLCLGAALLAPAILATPASAQSDAAGGAGPHLGMTNMLLRPGSKLFFLLGRSQALKVMNAGNQPVGHGASAPRSPGFPPANYIIVDAPGAGTGDGQGTALQAVNSSMVSSGFYIDSSYNNHGFVRAFDGTITSFDVDGPMSQTTATWMNNNGVVVGDYIDQGTGAQNGFALAPDGTLITFGAGTETNDGTTTNSISDKDEVVGDYIDLNGDEVFHGFLLANDAIESFDAPGAGTGAGQGTEGFDVNVTGAIVGPYFDANNVSHGFVRAKNGAFTSFDAPGAGSNAGQGTTAEGENSKGAVVGYYIDAGNVNHGFIRQPGGAIATFDAPDAGTSAGQGTIGFELNSKGNATGYYIDADGVLHGFERATNGTIVEFDAPGAGTGSELGTAATDISKSGVIAGQIADDSYVYHGFLRTR
jgi:hypothetical protein